MEVSMGHGDVENSEEWMLSCGPILAPPLTSCAILVKLLHLSEPLFHHL